MIWLGFDRFELEVDSDKRHSGKSSYTFFKKLRLATSTIISFSDRFLLLILSLGVLITFFSIILLLLHLFNVFVYGTLLSGWTSLILSIYFSLGVVISSIGIVGFYVGKIFSQAKRRPNYVISKKNNL